MLNQAANPDRIIDEWTSRTLDGTNVTYAVIGTHDSGFVYSADCRARSVKITAPQGPLDRERVEALFADSVNDTCSSRV